MKLGVGVAFFFLLISITDFIAETRNIFIKHLGE